MKQARNKTTTYKTLRGRQLAAANALAEYVRATAATSFPSFLVAVDTQYRMQWFHRLIADKCQQLADGRIKRLMLFVPPQHGKSEIISRKFPAWILGRAPETKMICCSYSSGLSTSFSRQVQRIMQSEQFSRIFPAATLTPATRGSSRKRTADYFDTDGEGFYKAVGVGGSLTGTPADIAIIDDPVKDAAEAYSITYRERVWDWYNSVLTTRLHNDSRQLFIMTRWHEDDLAGRILQAEPDLWDVVSIPALCEREDDNPHHSGRHAGDPLWPQKHSREKLLAQQARSPRDFAALYQQHPTIEGGNIVHRDWFPVVAPADFAAIHRAEPVHFYLDTAYNKRKAGADNDPSGILAAVRIRQDLYILHAQQVWKEMPDLLRFLPAYISAHEGSTRSRLNIEPKANGISVVQMLREATSLNVRFTPTPTDSKDVRLRVASPKIECGRVHLVRGTWNEAFLDELCGFPAMPHDEFVDILGYAIADLLDRDDPATWENIDKGIFG